MADTVQVEEEAGQGAGDVRKTGTAITPGIYVPGLGQTAGLRVLFTEKFLKEVASSFDGGYVNLDHRRDTEYEVGVIEKPRYEDGGLRFDLLLQDDRPRFNQAVSFIESREAQNQVANLSIEITDEQYIINTDPNGDYDLEIVSGRGLGVAILPTGACGPEDGCGIGMRSEAGVLRLTAHDPSITVTPGSTEDPDDKHETEGTTMSEGKEGQGSPPPAGSQGCGCQGSGGMSLEAAKGEAERLRTEAETKDTTIKELQEKLAAEEEARKAAETKVEVFLEAEHQATVDAVKQEAEAQGLAEDDVKELLGEEPSTEAATVALRALKLGGSKTRTGLKRGGGRSTAGNPREGAGTLSAEELKRQQYAKARERMGLTAPKHSGNLPLALAKNRPHLSAEKPDDRGEA